MRFPPFADLDRDQRKIYAESPAAGAMLVTGPPGTGKTVIAMHRALRLSKDKREVTIIMFNKVLSRYTGNFPDMPGNVRVTHMHEWVNKWYRGAFGRRPPTREKFVIDWDEVRRNIQGASQVQLGKLNWGHLVVDEGQDFEPAMYRALMALVRNSAIPEGSRPTLTVFADENQTIFPNNSRIVDLIEELNATVSAKRLWRLDRNYRNSLEIARFSKFFQVRGASGVRLPSRETGQPPTVFLHKNVDKPYDQIVRYATNKGSEEVGVIVFGRIGDVVRAYNKILHRANALDLDCRIQAYVSKHSNKSITDPQNLNFDSPPSITIVHSQSAKGLEFDAVFLLNVNALMARDAEELDSFKRLYVASSRSRDSLFILFTGDIDQNVVPDPVRLLPSPAKKLCKYIVESNVDAGETVLDDTVEWSDSAYEYQRAKLASDGLMGRLAGIDKVVLRDAFVEIAERTFYQQDVATMVEDRLDDTNALMDLVIELGPDSVIDSLGLR